MDFRRVMPDSTENRDAMFRMLLEYDEPYTKPGAPKRNVLPFFLGVTWNTSVLAFMTGPDAKDSFRFVVGMWTPWRGAVRVDLPFHEIRWIQHI